MKKNKKNKTWTKSVQLCVKKLEQLQKNETMTSKAKRISKDFYSEMEALLTKEVIINAFAFTEKSTNDETENIIIIK